jgi:hypothetical protein
MANNPLKKHFRQPKVFVNLPSKGLYNQPGTLAGEPVQLPVYGMTGMDEILLKTPDSLLTGESTIRVIESCCPTIKDAADLCLLDLDLILVAIRIATYGNTMSVTHSCPSCETINDYDIELGAFIEHFNKCQYENKIVLKDVSVKIRPLTYKAWCEFQVRNFGVQRQLQQAVTLTDEVEQNKIVTSLFDQISTMQNDTIMKQLESVQTDEVLVDQKEFLEEWLVNSESNVFDSIREQIEKNRTAWDLPKIAVVCNDCGHKHDITVNMDQSSFFVNA